MGRNQAVMATLFSLPALLAMDLFPSEKTLIAIIDTTLVFLAASQARGGGGERCLCSPPLLQWTYSLPEKTLPAIINTTFVSLVASRVRVGGTACECMRRIFAQTLVRKLLHM